MLVPPAVIDVTRTAASALVSAAPAACAVAMIGAARGRPRALARASRAQRLLAGVGVSAYALSLATHTRSPHCDASAVATVLLAMSAAFLPAQAALASRPAASAVAAAAAARRRLPPRAASVGLLVLGAAWAVAASAFSAAAAAAGVAPSGRAARAAAALCCLAAATASTHGLGGPALVAGFRFVAPLKGGSIAVALQAVAWAVTGAATLGLLRLAAAGASVAATTLLAVSAPLAQVLLAASLLLWRAGGRGKAGAAAAAAARAPLSPALAKLATLPTALLIYAPAHATAGAAAALVAASPWRGAAVLAGLTFSYYAHALLRHRPSLHVGRAWPAFRAAVGARAQAALEAWHGGCEVVWDDLTDACALTAAAAAVPPSAPAAAGRRRRAASASPNPWAAHPRLLLAYAPHGLYPVGLLALTLLPGFRARWPRGRAPPVPLVASAVLWSPVLRDVAAWLGARVVSRATLARALAVDGAAALVPGGQAELVHAHALASRRALVIVRRHAGFVRAAVAAGAALVPVLALGEGAALRDLLPLPRLKAASIRAAGFPFPFLLGGRWGVTPLPRAGTPLRFVVGPPVVPPPGLTGEAAVRAAHAAFYDALAALFERHARCVPGYEDVALEWADEGPAGWAQERE